MKNKYEVRGDVTVIFLKSKKHGDLEATINTSRLERVKEFPNTWFVHEKKNKVYVRGNSPMVNGKQETILLHRWITDAPDGMVVDHIYHNGLDNTDGNLRVVTIGENLQNRKGANVRNTSGVRGVHYHKKSNKWYVRIQVNKVLKHIGCFTDIQEAERVAIEYRAKHMPFSQEASA